MSLQNKIHVHHICTMVFAYYLVPTGMLQWWKKNVVLSSIVVQDLHGRLQSPWLFQER